MSFAAQAVIDRQALRHNVALVRKTVGDSKIMACIKANGYGHDLSIVANALADQVNGFAVARLDEALTVRQGGWDQRVLLLEGFLDPRELEAIREHDLDIVVHHVSQLEALEQFALHHPASRMTAWLKIDTGMHRLGFSLSQAHEALQRLKDLPIIRQPMQVMSHFACADELDHPGMMQRQLGRWRSLALPPEHPVSLANSAALLAWPETHADWVRPGMMLFGVSPFADRCGSELGLKPVMTLETRLIATNDVEAGEPVGYGASWETPEPMRLGVAAIGYGDGYPRHAPSGTPVWVNGREAALAGRVSMDLLTIDLRNAPDARVGDRVVLWGPDLSVERVAAAAGTIGYELVTRLASRVQILEQ